MGVFVRDQPALPESLAAAGWKRAAPSAANAPRTITAAGEPVRSITPAAASARSARTWQQDAWTAYDRVGEVHFGFNMIATVLSMVRMYPGIVRDPAAPPTPLHSDDEDLSEDDRKLAAAASQTLAELTGSGWPDAVRTFSLNMSVAGEVFLTRLPIGQLDPTGKPSGGWEWLFKSVDELEITADGSRRLHAFSGRRGTGQELPKDTYVYRVWRKHPRYSQEPDSSLAPLTDAVESLLLLGRMERNATMSRLNAGVVYFPQSITAMSQAGTAEAAIPDPGDPAPQPVIVAGSDQFMQQFMESLTTPIGDSGSAASVVPMMLTGPDDAGDKIKHITFERKSDQWLADRQERWLERILQGVDMPKELVTGLANVRYSNAIVITQDLYNVTIDPACLVLADTITHGYLLPRLRAQNFTEQQLAGLVAWYDPSEIVVRTSAGSDADVGYDKGLLSAETWRREKGFSDDDAASDMDLARKLVLNATTPAEALTQLLLQVLPEILKGGAEGGGETPLPERAQRLLSVVNGEQTTTPDTGPPPGGSLPPVPPVDGP